MSYVSTTVLPAVSIPEADCTLVQGVINAFASPLANILGLGALGPIILLVLAVVLLVVGAFARIRSRVLTAALWILAFLIASTSIAALVTQYANVPCFT